MDTNNLHITVVCILFVLCGLGQSLDCRTTVVGLAHGFIESNSWAIKIDKLLHEPGFFILKIMVVPSIGIGLFAKFGFVAAAIWLSILTAQGWITGVRNWLLLRKHNIAVW